MFDGMRRWRILVISVSLISLLALVCAGAGIASALAYDQGKQKVTNKGAGEQPNIDEEYFYAGEYSAIPNSPQQPHAPYYFLGGDYEVYYVSGGESEPRYTSGGEAETYYEDAEIPYYYYYWIWYWVWMMQHWDDFWDDDTDDDYYTDDDYSYY